MDSRAMNSFLPFQGPLGMSSPPPYSFLLGVPQLLRQIPQGVPHGGYVHLWAGVPGCRGGPSQR